MQKVKFGKTQLKAARFGLGCMRFPKSQEETSQLVRYALDNGINYLDTAYIYKDSEEKLGIALQGGYRNKAIIATKSPVWDVKKYDDFEKYLDEELIRLKTDYVDLYLLHSLGSQNYESVLKYDGFTFLDKMVKKGKIRHKAFSFHGTNELFKEIFDAFDWEMAQVQLNILDEFQQAGLDGLVYAHNKGAATVVMEPLRGGHLITNYPTEIDKLLDEYPTKRLLIEWAFRWLYSLREADVILSGVSTLEQLKQNLAIFEQGEYDCMSKEDLFLMTQVREIFEKKNAVNCTSCGYCMPCPYDVNIPEVFKLYNSVSMMSNHFIDKLVYKDSLMFSGNGADKCVDCGVCKVHCPQSIDIPEELKKAHSVLTNR